MITKESQPQWISMIIIELIADRDSAFTESYKMTNPSSKEASLNEAKQLKTIVKQLIGNASADHIRHNLDVNWELIENFARN